MPIPNHSGRTFEPVWIVRGVNISNFVVRGGKSDFCENWGGKLDFFQQRMLTGLCSPLGLTCVHVACSHCLVLAWLLDCLTFFLFLYFSKSFFIKIYFRFYNLQIYTPIARLRAGRPSVGL